MLTLPSTLIKVGLSTIIASRNQVLPITRHWLQYIYASLSWFGSWLRGVSKMTNTNKVLGAVTKIVGSGTCAQDLLFYESTPIEITNHQWWFSNRTKLYLFFFESAPIEIFANHQW